jgi:hypothetical protein
VAPIGEHLEQHLDAVLAHPEDDAERTVEVAASRIGHGFRPTV